MNIKPLPKAVFMCQLPGIQDWRSMLMSIKSLPKAVFKNMSAFRDTVRGEVYNLLNKHAEVQVGDI